MMQYSTDSGKGIVLSANGGGKLEWKRRASVVRWHTLPGLTEGSEQPKRTIIFVEIAGQPAARLHRVLEYATYLDIYWGQQRVIR